MKGRTHTPGRRAAVAITMAGLVWTSVASPVSADGEPAEDPSVAVGELDGDLVAVGLPPVPAVGDEGIAVGELDGDLVAVGLPPVPPAVETTIPTSTIPTSTIPTSTIPTSTIPTSTIPTTTVAAIVDEIVEQAPVPVAPPPVVTEAPDEPVEMVPAGAAMRLAELRW